MAEIVKADVTAASSTASPKAPEKVVPKGSAADGGESEVTEDEDEDPDSEEAPKGELHKSKRWQRVHGELKEFKQFRMSPLELQAALVRLHKLEKASAKVEAAEGASPEDKELAERRKAARKELSKIAPELDSVVETKGKADLFFASIERRAVRETKKLMGEAGMATGDKNLEAMTDVLAGIIGDDDELYDEYLTNPKFAVGEAFKKFKSGFEAAATRAAKAGIQRDKTKLLGLPKSTKGGGTSSEVAKNRTEGPKNLNEARRSAEARLAQLEE